MTLGQATQVKARLIGILRLGNTKTTQIGALIQCVCWITCHGRRWTYGNEMNDLLRSTIRCDGG